MSGIELAKRKKAPRSPTHNFISTPRMLHCQNLIKVRINAFPEARALMTGVAGRAHGEIAGLFTPAGFVLRGRTR
jgi:hypothetical protein